MLRGWPRLRYASWAGATRPTISCKGALLGAAGAYAARVPLRLEIDPCTGTDQALVRRLVALELGGTLDDEQPSGAMTVVRVDCRDAQVSPDPATNTGHAYLVRGAAVKRSMGR
jgi:hypothetical protein